MSLSEYAEARKSWYKFPQYLWQIGTRHGPIMLRRGNTPEEALEKCLAKDVGYSDFSHWMLPVGAVDCCEIDDAKLYSTSHNWDWMNE